LKVLQTLGRHGGGQEGIFQYKRDHLGVMLDLTVGQAAAANHQYLFTDAEWALLLSAIGAAVKTTFRITGDVAAAATGNVLYRMFQVAVPVPAHGFGWNDSVKAAIVAVLEHEGTLDLYHGPVGKGQSWVRIVLSK